MSDLNRLINGFGIAADYCNYRGEHVSVPIENQIVLVESLGIDTKDPICLQRESYRLETESWTNWLKPMMVEPYSQIISFDINLSADEHTQVFTWEIEDALGQHLGSGQCDLEGAVEIGETVLDGCAYSRWRTELMPLEPNYYTLIVKSAGKQERATLVVYPDSVYDPGTHSKVWGVIIQLYTLRSVRNWGIGDFSDLNVLLEKLAGLGANVVGLNPLHALSSDLDTYFSPYSPSDRRFLSPLYIDIEALVDFDASLKSQVDYGLIHTLRSGDNVDYARIRDLKYSTLQSIFTLFVERELNVSSSRAECFLEFVTNRGDSLLQFACFEAKNQHWDKARFVFNGEDYSVSDLTDNFPSNSEAPFAAIELTVLFHCYLQWLAEEQLENCQQSALNLGMSIGVIRDLAVGADINGAEVTLNPELFCKTASIGAPPDAFASNGQNWGLPPVMPAALRRTAFAHYIELLRTNMQHCGALRIDHAMGLMRLWWCPSDKTADKGAYVYYPFEEMFALLRLESHLHRCMIIGEDLGIVPTNFRESIDSANVISNRVFYFEKDHENRLKVPESYDENALAMVNNHDLPTLVSWWNGADLKLRKELGMLGGEVNYDELLRVRHEEKSQLMFLLFENGCYPESWRGRLLDAAADRELIDATIRYLSRTRSRIFVIQLEDLLAMESPVNVPGTFEEYPNWQRKISLTLDQIFSDSQINALLNKINIERNQISCP